MPHCYALSPTLNSFCAFLNLIPTLLSMNQVSEISPSQSWRGILLVRPHCCQLWARMYDIEKRNILPANSVKHIAKPNPYLAHLFALCTRIPMSLRLPSPGSPACWPPSPMGLYGLNQIEGISSNLIIQLAEFRISYKSTFNNHRWSLTAFYFQPIPAVTVFRTVSPK